MEKVRPVIVLDDREDQLLKLLQLLRNDGFTVWGFLKPNETLESIREHNPALVICDYLMPEMNGIDFYARIKEENLLTNGFFLLVTIDKQPGEEGDEFHDLPDGWISKTITDNDFLESVNQWYKMVPANL